MADVDDVLSLADEGGGHEIHALLAAEDKIALVLIRQRRQRDLDTCHTTSMSERDREAHTHT